MKYVTEAAFNKMVTLQKGYIDTQVGTKQDKFIVGDGLELKDGKLSVKLDTSIFKVVDSLPGTPATGDENKIHLVLSSTSETGNLYSEYLWVNSKWEEMGTFKASVDLTPYLEKDDLTSDVKANYVDILKEQVSLAKIAFGTTLAGAVSGKTVTLNLAEVLSAEVAKGMYKVQVDKYGRIIATEAITAADIKGLGFMTSTEVTTELNKKLNSSTYETDKSNLESRLDELEETVGVGEGSEGGSTLVERVETLEGQMAAIEVFDAAAAETLFKSIYGEN